MRKMVPFRRDPRKRDTSLQPRLQQKKKNHILGILRTAPIHADSLGLTGSTPSWLCFPSPTCRVIPSEDSRDSEAIDPTVGRLFFFWGGGAPLDQHNWNTMPRHAVRAPEIAAVSCLPCV